MAEDGGVAAVERALAILDALTTEKMTLAELASRTGMYKSTLLRLSKSLERYQFVYRSEDGMYRLGAKVLALGSIYQRNFRMADVVLPVLRHVVDAIQEGASFYVGDGDSRICLHRVDADRAIRDSVREGDRLPLTLGAAAHVIRAFTGARGARYDQVRREMYSASFGERDVETAAVAAPVFGVEQKFVGAISVSGPRYRIESMGTAPVVAVLFEHARALTRTLGGNCDAPEFAGWIPAAKPARKAAKKPARKSAAKTAKADTAKKA